MPVQILEAVERQVASDLLDVSSIYEKYLDVRDIFSRIYINFATITGSFLDENGDPVTYTPRQIVRDSVVLLVPLAQPLLFEIRRLNALGLSTTTDLFVRLARLQIRRIDEPDHKGLFLLASRACEDAANVNGGE